MNRDTGIYLYTERDYGVFTAGHHIEICGLIDSIRLSANQQMIQLKLIENLQREWQCQIKIVHLSLRIP